MTMQHTETLIVGGGLCGLQLANILERSGQDYLLVEARSRLGGRILTAPHGGASFDLGPAWFWPDQPRMAALVAQLGLEVFEQYSEGNFRFEDAQGRVTENHGFGSMRGSLRISGGIAAMSDALAKPMSAANIITNSPVTRLVHGPAGLTAEINGEPRIQANRVVMALPPRVAAQVVYSPELSQDTQSSLTNIPTWMAGQAKAIAVYETPFWREAGLSGDAMSQRGPMVEIHDASPVRGGPYALFGFIGIPPQHRQDRDALRQAVADQFARLFGPDAPQPQALLVQDWAIEKETATSADHAPLTAHPRYGTPPALLGLWQDRLVFSGTETAPEFGGFLEGALEAAEITAQTIYPQEQRA